MRPVKPWLSLYPDNIGEFTDVDDASLPEMLEQAVGKYGDKKALTFYWKSWSYRELAGAAELLAASLHAAGFQKGDRVALMLPNSPHYIFSFFAALRLGGIVTQVNPMYVEREIEHILTDSGARYMVVLDMMYGRVKQVQPKTPLEKVIVVQLTGQGIPLQDGDIDFEEFMRAHTAPAPQVPIEPHEDVAVLQYTGGTTGVSKGVMLTHRNIMANLKQNYDFIFSRGDFPEHAKAINVLPMFHIYGLTCLTLLCIYAGNQQIILPRFDAREALETIKSEQPHMFSAVPTMFIAMNSQPDLEDFGLENVKYFNSGGAAMPVEALHMFEKRTGNRAHLYEGYGLSEASPVTHMNPPFHERRPGSIGIPLPSTDAKVVWVTDKGFEEAPIGEAGELIIKGPQVMKGYWGLPEETAAVLKDGWLFTGDIARMEADGYFYIVDRKKDMIIASGYNVYPREIEEVLYQHPDIQEAMVLGVPDEYRGETVKAFLRRREGGEITAEEIIAYCKAQLAPYKVPKQIEFRDELPKSAVGKLLKRTLRDQEIQKLKKTP
ncbi:long-chain fatty acid--CoA ligase [Aneurinibacillus sp. Ricciae_BoGa-3]|uniref:long-chain-fatty-acid--CoA ligase n=1 Tax=Aneurinibacillus sp. Ricciae_BoGa-3 TaxID=3022697 RepID=UPI0023403399|nr:long-chain fatty acid--CoA ligase [Aneurinibacillus sp. Ricciae_BoGa-3]WCK52793.1 long-chain fatty acid--CoA ligase [Aneurinibacillus sp. Ricciae_BoGa-3]